MQDLLIDEKIHQQDVMRKTRLCTDQNVQWLGSSTFADKLIASGG